MKVTQELSKDHPMMKAWDNYKEGKAFEVTKKYAMDPSCVEGSLWAAFVSGWESAMLHKDKEGNLVH